MQPKTPLGKLTGFGPTYLNRLSRLGLETVEDLIYHFPFRYEDLSAVKKIAELKVEEIATVRGEVWEIENIRTFRGKFLTKAIVNDGSSSIDVVWFNQPYLTKTIKVGTKISLAGKVGLFNSRLSFTSPDYELGERKRHTGRLVPIYPETEGLTSKWLRNKISQILPAVIGSLEEYLPQNILSKYNLLPLTEALTKVHWPENTSDIDSSRRRFGFEEFFLLNLAALIRKTAWQKNEASALEVDQEKVTNFISTLPFRLTSAQNKVLQEILGDLGLNKPMNRLLLGDVGSGKTVVAAVAAYIAQLNGKKTVLMAPTEILAWQHFKTLDSMLSPHRIKIGLRTGSKKLDGGNVVVGTHALLSKAAEFPNLGLVVIDEQHRFGVAQRATLKEKGKFPHLLTMSATPIPRTLALTLYGDLDLSVIDELPPGRKIVKTYLTPPEKRDKAYEFIRGKIQSGQQTFIITPLIEPSESLSTLKSAKAEYERLKEEVFPDLKLGLLHGRLKPKEKDQVLTAFRDKKYDILVSTPVVEVGIDIPNATVMVIEGAERFGLAQLHQLRGRVGRGEEESWCLLFSDDPSYETNQRLKAMETHHLGPELAELDLKLRGPGEIYGLRQSGIPDLKIAKLTDTVLIRETRQAAESYLKENQTIPTYLKEKMGVLISQAVAPD